MPKFRWDNPEWFASQLNKSGTRVLARDVWIKELGSKGWTEHAATPLVQLWRDEFVKRTKLFGNLARGIETKSFDLPKARVVIDDLRWRHDHLNSYVAMLGGEAVRLDFGNLEAPDIGLLEREEESLIQGLKALEDQDPVTACDALSRAAKANALRLAGLYALCSPGIRSYADTDKLVDLVSIGIEGDEGRLARAWSSAFELELRKSGAAPPAIDLPRAAGPEDFEKILPRDARVLYRDASEPQASEPVASERTPFRRTPHMDLPERALEPEESFTVGVYLDTKAPTGGQEVESLEIDLPDDVFILELDVHLIASGHFEIQGDRRRKLLVERGEELSEHLTFTVSVRSATEITSGDNTFDPAKGYLSAIFYCGNRPVGKVASDVSINVAPARTHEAPVSTREGPPAAVVRIESDAPDPEFLVHIEDVDKSGRRYHARVYSKHLSGTHREESWTLPSTVREIVLTELEGFIETAPSRVAKLDRLKGAGVAFFAAAPDVFKTALWELIDARKAPRSITIVSAEPYLPWELMVPFRESGGVRKDYRKPLGVEFSIGRWVTKQGTSANRRLVLRGGRIVAPAYSGSRALPHVAKEVSYLERQFQATRIDPSDYATIRSALLGESISLLHFACHGKTDGSRQALDLGAESMLASQLAAIGAEGHAFCGASPLVFLNACEIGQNTRALLGIGGFPQEFAHLGACAVVAPLWAVSDKTAPDVATSFYDAICSDDRPTLAEALARVRGRAYEAATQGDDTYAAYCFYGDPEARLA